jgi:hypothetical protein
VTRAARSAGLTRQPTQWARLAARIVDVAARAGADAEALRRAADLAGVDLWTVEARVPLLSVYALLEAADAALANSRLCEKIASGILIRGGGPWPLLNDPWQRSCKAGRAGHLDARSARGPPGAWQLATAPWHFASPRGPRLDDARMTRWTAVALLLLCASLAVVLFGAAHLIALDRAALFAKFAEERLEQVEHAARILEQARG